MKPRREASRKLPWNSRSPNPAHNAARTWSPARRHVAAERSMNALIAVTKWKSRKRVKARPRVTSAASTSTWTTKTKKKS